ncbi:MAG: cobalamin B12-binding domain-containing protein [Methanobacteriota archaeon]|nr:MAG: cobalamin B12-binding domain-containing protein [Euryarchaeota archaeon]
MRVLAASVGNCVHVAGVQAFLDVARSFGYETVFLGPAMPIDKLTGAIKQHEPDLVALSYRLSEESAKAVFEDLRKALDSNPDIAGKRFLFGGTPPVARLARESGMFEAAFDGSEPLEVTMAVLRGSAAAQEDRVMGDTLMTRLQTNHPFPLIRHHFGQPDLQETIDGVRRLAESGALDVISIAPDQNAQESFFRPDEMDSSLAGAGGVPLRSQDDLEALYQAAQTGNKPLLRCYSGTRDLIKWGGMLKETIKVAWGAVPLTWYSELDSRSKRPLLDAIKENQKAIRWYAKNDIPVEVNESHQWALRRSGDTVELATAYLAAHNAKALGVRNYVCQFMFDTPRGISPAMDLAKMFAKLDLVESLSDVNFNVIRMVRSGLSSLSPKPNLAKGQLAASIYSAMALKPHIVHVVGYSEADHVATADEIVESCELANGVIRKALLGVPTPETDPAVAERKAQLLADARFLIEAIKRLEQVNTHDPLIRPEVIATAIKEGILDAPDLRGSRVARGRITTAMVNGACVPVDSATGRALSEKERIDEIAISEKDLDLAEI